MVPTDFKDSYAHHYFFMDRQRRDAEYEAEYATQGLSYNRTHRQDPIDSWDSLFHRAGTHRFKALPYILDGTLKHLPDETGFADDGLFREYAYWIDFENKVLEIEGLEEEVVKIEFGQMRKGLVDDLVNRRLREY